MKKVFALILTILLAVSWLTGCAGALLPGKKQYSATFLELFDTVTTVVGRDHSEEAFQAKAQAIRDDLQYYHQLFDIYHDYENVANIKTINDHAGIAPVVVEPAVIAFLLDCKSYYTLTDGKVNVAMGSVLQLWHVARDDGIRDPDHARLPDKQQLQKAAQHSAIESVVIDEAASTVFITDPATQLDVGAVAKGWAVQRVAENAPTGMLISVGGNVCATGPKSEDGTPWVIGIQDPNNADKNLHTIHLAAGTVVTSGDYQRTYTVDGKEYHHIIDPETQMPATNWRSVSVVCSDSGLADALSTGLFLMDLEQGKRLAQACGAQILWVDREGNEFMTSGFESMLQNEIK